MLELTFHGVTATIACDDDEVLRRVACDFSYFRAPGASATGPAGLAITARRRAPEYASLPPLAATVYTPRNVCFSSGDVTYIDYFGRALAVYHHRERRFEVDCPEVDLLHEIVYLTILSRVGERLEERRLHRIHALAVEVAGRSALFLMPSGGGKTTLALEFLRRGDPYRLVSEDSPLVGAGGRLLPFPLRLGILATQPPPFAAEHVTHVRRMEFEPKYLVSLDAFPGALAGGTSMPELLFVGRRTLGCACSIVPAGRRVALRALLESMVVGVGLYQGVEFLLRTSALDLARMGGVVASRTQRALALARRCQAFVVDLGRDPAHNAEKLLGFLAERGFGPPAAFGSQPRGNGGPDDGR